MKNLSLLLRIYILLIIVVGFLGILFLTFHFIDYLNKNLEYKQELISNWWWLPVWAIVLAVTQFSPVKVHQVGVAISVESAILIALILIFGPGIAACYGVLSALILDGIIRRVPIYKVGFNAAQLGLAYGIAGLVYIRAGGELFIIIPDDFKISMNIFIPLFLSVLTYFLINSFSVSIAIGLQTKIPVLRVWRSHFQWTIFNNIALIAPLGLVMALINIKISPWALIFFFLPLIFVQYSLKLYLDLREEHLAAIAALCSAQDASDRYTFGHSERVSELAEKIARLLKLPDKEVDTIRYAGQLHDIGKIGIDYKVVQKPGPLNLREWAEIKKHPAIGAEILKNLKFLKEATPYVEMHHERLDGGGYPLGKSADEIPLGARIIKVADAFDAMTSERAYRPAMTIEQAVQLLKKDSGDQYDPKVVQALTDLISQGDIDIESAHLPVKMRESFEKSVSVD